MARAHGRWVGAVLVIGAVCAQTAYAAAPEDAPQESRDQVEAALKLLATGFASSARSIAAGAPGTIEHVISKFAPAKFHPVDEGTLGPLRKSGSCPDGMALVAQRVCVDRWEAHLVERGAGGDETLYSPYLAPAAGRTYLARTAPGFVPQAYITGNQAASACRASGKRLCHPVEWRLACGGKQGFAYPYGKTRTPNTCRDRGTAPMMVYHASTLKRGWGRDELNDTRLNQHPNTVAKTGSHEGCVNDYGLFDMVGNLHEWSADPNGTFQGGYWLDTSQHGDGCAYRTIAHPFDYSDYSIGFRCCADPS